jgi:hypothetical protein
MELLFLLFIFYVTGALAIRFFWGMIRILRGLGRLATTGRVDPEAARSLGNFFRFIGSILLVLLIFILLIMAIANAP